MLYYFLIAWRNIRRNKGFAFLNIIGFSLGLSAFLLVVLFVADELSYDRHHQYHDKIFRADTELKYSGVLSEYAIAAPPVAEALVDNFPEVEATVRMTPVLNQHFRKGNEIIREDHVMYADSSLFDVFTFPLIAGETRNALIAPGSIVVTESIAVKYFNSTDIVGKVLAMEDNSTYTITAVLKDMPAQSHFHADIFLPLSSQSNARNSKFNQFTFNTYVRLKEAKDAIALQGKLPAFLNKHLSNDMDVGTFEKNGSYIRIQLTPLTDIHLFSNKQRELEGNSDITYVYIFSSIAALILLLACINFTNLFTARSANRAREVGVRKVLGSARRNIMVQFFTESLMMTVISVMVGLAVAGVCLPVFNTLAGKDIQISFGILLKLIPVVVIMTLVVAGVAGVYPAFYLSGFQPLNVLRGKLALGFRNSGLRRTLVVIQFSIATFLTVGTLVILAQLKFIQDRNIGFNRDQVLIVKNVSTMNEPRNLKHEVDKISGVLRTSLSGYLPTIGARWQRHISIPDERALLSEFWLVDPDYIPTLQMTMAAGRNFADGMMSDSSAMIINESAASMLGLSPNPLNKIVETGGERYTVIGVVKDFNFNSLRENVSPLAMILDSDWQSSLIVRSTAGQISTVIDQIRSTWEKLNPDHALEFSFMDSDFEIMYVAEQRMQRLFLIFTALALTVAGIGLFGLSAYAAEQRAGELSIRKIFGASVGNLFKLLSMDFILLVAIAIVISMPLTWLMMDRWLDGFAYKIDIPVWTLISSAGLVLTIALVTITFQTLKAALNNPIKALRQED